MVIAMTAESVFSNLPSVLNNHSCGCILPSAITGRSKTKLYGQIQLKFPQIVLRHLLQGTDIGEFNGESP